MVVVAFTSANAATFGAKPNAVTIDPQHPIAQISISSLYARVVAFDVRVHRWSQNADGDIVATDEVPGLIVLPPIFSIPPYDTTLLRVAFRQRSAPPTIEASYKVVMTEIAPAKDPPQRVITVPLFVRPASRSGGATYTLKLSGGNTAYFTINNAANAHIYLGKLSIKIDDKTVYNGNPASYVLAGSARTLPLRLTAPVIGQRADLKFETEDGTSQSAQATVFR